MENFFSIEQDDESSIGIGVESRVFSRVIATLFSWMSVWLRIYMKQILDERSICSMMIKQCGGVGKENCWRLLRQ